MIIQAKFPGRCAVCGGAIEPGSKIEWERGKPVSHAACAKRAAKSWRKPAAAPPQPKSVRVTDAEALAASGDPSAVLAEPREEQSLWSDLARKIGQIVRYRGSYYVVVATEPRYYHSEDDCEDRDCFCGRYGWRYPYRAVKLADCASRRSDEEAAARKAAEEAAKKAEVQSAKERFFGTIPADYCRTEGVAVDAQWTRVSAWRDDGASSVGWTAMLPDGRPVFRLDAAWYDDSRVIHFLPQDEFLRLARAQASREPLEWWQEYVEKYPGCVGGDVALVAVGREEEALARARDWKKP